MEEMLEPRKPAQVTLGDLDDSSESVVTGELAVKGLPIGRRRKIL